MMPGIRPPISAGRLTALMPVSGGPARVVAHLRMRCLAHHPILGTDGLGGRSKPLRAAWAPAEPVH